MLALRGCRLGITYPEITEMQAHAIFEAAAAVKKSGQDPHLEIMIPLTTGPEEFKAQAAIIHQVAHDVFIKKGLSVEYKVGTMIELPRACIVADKIAADAEFFSFGTNDLTQTTFGISRDDCNKFLPAYLQQGIFKQDPFAVLDQEGVGTLIKMAANKGRSARRDLEIGICGEHGGEPESVKFCHRAGLDYVSCSPYRLLTARLAAAQAAIEEQKIFNPDLRTGNSK
jgi:pyruvate,orthophosphate dikinase